VFSAYDYSHLLPALDDDLPSSSSSSSPLAVAGRLPETERVVQQPRPSAVQSAAVTEQEQAKHGRMNFACRLGLTVDEAAVITVPARLYAAALSAGRGPYAGVAQALRYII
jgi:hypothetical protein